MPTRSEASRRTHEIKAARRVQLYEDAKVYLRRARAVEWFEPSARLNRTFIGQLTKGHGSKVLAVHIRLPGDRPNGEVQGFLAKIARLGGVACVIGEAPDEIGRWIAGVA